MKLRIEIDDNSGFCNGVVRAVRQAENWLKYNNHLYSLGAIVHNSEELERLSAKGLIIIDKDQMAALNGEMILFRAHGEPPSTYRLAKNNNLQIIDCTCPVVLKLQERIAKEYEEIKKTGGQLVIFGKIGHAEVNGLVGQIDNNAIVVQNIGEIQKIDFDRPVALFSQTTKDPKEFKEVAEAVKSKSRSGDVRIFDTVCRQVASRHILLAEFAKKHDVILFVCGRESSNGKVLFELCSRSNSRSYHLESKNDIKMEWFRDGDSVGICGATSTPKWQLEDIRAFFEEIKVI